MSEIDVPAVLTAAWRAVKEADLPPEIHALAFTEAVRLTAPEAPAAGGGGVPAPTPSGHESPGGRPDAGSLSEREIVERVVRQTSADLDKVSDLIYMDEGVIRISRTAVQLGATNSERTRNVAKLLAVIRGFGIPEDETPLQAIRDELTRLKCYDSGNFATYMKAVDGFVLTGSGNNRRIRPRIPGIQAFPALVDSLVSDT